MIGITAFLSKIIKILHSDASPAQIAGGVCFGMILGLTPLFNIHNVAVLFLILIVRVNPGSAWVSFIGFSILAFALDPVSHIVGLKVLKAEALFGFWTDVYNVPLMTWTRFNNSVVMGSLSLSLLFFTPLFVFSYWFVKNYRIRFQPWFDKLKVIQMIKGSSVYQWYMRIKGLTE